MRHFQPADALADRPDGVGLRRVHGDRAVEHRAVAKHGKTFRADLRAGQIAAREIVFEDDQIEVPAV